MTITKREPIKVLPKRLRVAAYARVSSGKDAMLHSLAAQVSYYNNLIRKNPAWEFAGIYVDEALTGTKDSRPEFQRMIADCKAGKIDRILTKSISRFARNTVTILENVRMLKSMGVDVYFEEANIHSSDAGGELMLTLLASFAQEESLSASENQKWRIRTGFEKGETMCWRYMLGYKIKNGKVTIDPDGAATVREIFRRAVEGESYGSICRSLKAEGKRGYFGGELNVMRIKEILGNEKYTGDALLQKTYIKDHLSKKQLRNNGELAQYYATETHPAIIDKATFDAAQAVVRMKEVKCTGYAKQTKSEFTSKIRCPHCGANYKRVTKNGKSGWNCRTYLTKGIGHCRGKKIPEDTLRMITMDVLGMDHYDPKAVADEIEHIDVPADNHLTFHLTDGSIVKRTWADRSRRDSWTPEMREKARRTACRVK